MRFEDMAQIDREDFFSSLEGYTDIPVFLVEKDIWLCLVMRNIFGNPKALPMVFKGGTSLSKVYGAIDRFSEDVDVSIDSVAVVEKYGRGKFDPSTAGRAMMDKVLESVETSVPKYIEDAILPELKREVEALGCMVSFEKDDKGRGENVFISYPVATEVNEYIKPVVRVEFGGRNLFSEEFPKYDVLSYASEIEIPVEMSFPSAPLVVVLPVERTFHEKATILHVFCNRRESGHVKKTERASRHWYDFAKLYENPLCSSAPANVRLLADVVRHKTKFFRDNRGGYEKCLLGEMKFVPEGDLLDELRKDYDAMRKSNMFFGVSVPPPEFESIMATVARAETEMNGHVKAVMSSEPSSDDCRGNDGIV